MRKTLSSKDEAPGSPCGHEQQSNGRGSGHLQIMNISCMLHVVHVICMTVSYPIVPLSLSSNMVSGIVGLDFCLGSEMPFIDVAMLHAA